MENNNDSTQQAGFQQHSDDEVVTTSNGKILKNIRDKDGNYIYTKEIYIKKKKTDENKKTHKIVKRVKQAGNFIKNNWLAIAGALIYTWNSMYAAGVNYNYVHFLSSNFISNNLHGYMKTSPVSLILTGAISFVALRSTSKSYKKIKSRGEKCDSEEFSKVVGIAALVVSFLELIITLISKHYLPIDVIITILAAVTSKIISKAIEKKDNKESENDEGLEDRGDHTVAREHVSEPGRTR